MPEPLLEEVFKISGVPTHTFVEPSQFGELKVGLRSPGRGLVVEGPSGIGKSTAVARALGELNRNPSVTTALSARDPNDIGYIELLPEMADFGFVIVDDFHVLADEIRASIADLLKRLADTESATSKLIVIGINRAGDSLIEARPRPRQPHRHHPVRGGAGREGPRADLLGRAGIEHCPRGER
jgi:hypothetical protein